MRQGAGRAFTGVSERHCPRLALVSWVPAPGKSSGGQLLIGDQTPGFVLLDSGVPLSSFLGPLLRPKTGLNLLAKNSASQKTLFFFLSNDQKLFVCLFPGNGTQMTRISQDWSQPTVRSNKPGQGPRELITKGY